MNQFIKYLAICFLLSYSVGLVAEPEGGHREDHCKNERQTYCKSSRPGPETDHCLKDNLGKLSESCKTHLTEMIARHEKFRTACKTDEEKYCASANDPREKMNCLRNNESKLSASCKAALPPPPPDRH